MSGQKVQHLQECTQQMARENVRCREGGPGAKPEDCPSLCALIYPYRFFFMSQSQGQAGTDVAGPQDVPEPGG